MRIESHNPAQADAPIHLSSAIRQTAEEYSEKEGLSLDEFVANAVEQRLDYLKQQEWVRNRRQPTPELMAHALALLDLAGNEPPVAGDELPHGYRRRE